MYDIDGEFGQVRHVIIPLDGHTNENFDTPFHFNNAGWHRCNDLYKITRKQGKKGHLLLFSLSDGGTMQLTNRPPIKIPASSVAWIPAHSSHAYYTDSGKIWEFYWLDVSEKDNFLFSNIFNEDSILHLSDMKQIATEMERFLQNRMIDKQEFLLESSRMIGNIYHSLLAENISKKRIDKRDDLINNIMHNMETYYDQDLNLSELSKQYFISVPQLIRRFKAVTEMTPHAYLMAIRLQAAERYLQHTGCSIEEISRKTGFSCASNFIQQFRKHYGIPPHKYRKTH